MSKFLRYSTFPQNEPWYLRAMASKSREEVGHTKEGQQHANRLDSIANMLEVAIADEQYAVQRAEGLRWIMRHCEEANPEDGGAADKALREIHYKALEVLNATRYEHSPKPDEVLTVARPDRDETIDRMVALRQQAIDKGMPLLSIDQIQCKAGRCACCGGKPHAASEVRLNDDATLDEVCNDAGHLEQCHSGLWFLQIGDVAVWLTSKRSITASYERREMKRVEQLTVLRKENGNG